MFLISVKILLVSYNIPDTSGYRYHVYTSRQKQLTQLMDQIVVIKP